MMMKKTMKKLSRSVNVAKLCAILVLSLRLSHAHASPRREGDEAEPAKERDARPGPHSAGPMTRSFRVLSDPRRSQASDQKKKDPVPDGYARAKDGTLVRTHYNLARRFYLGGGHAPGHVSGALATGRGLLEIGSDLEWSGRMYEHLDFMKIRYNPGAFGPGRRLTVESADYLYVARRPMELFKLDVPLVPWGHEVKLRAGLLARFPTFTWFQAGEGARDHVLFLDWMTPRFVVDLWQSEDSRSYLRLGVGVGFATRVASTDWKAYSNYVSPVGLLHFRTRSKTGLHNFEAGVSTEPMLDVSGGPSRSRVRGSAAYEVVLFAINEQPFSLYGEARYDYNDAVGLRYKPHEATFLLGGRLSFGAK